MVNRQAPEGVAIGAQAVGLDVGVPAIILGAGDGEAIAEPIKLLGIDRIHLETAFPAVFRRSGRAAPRSLRRSSPARLRCSTATRAGLGQPATVIGKGALADNLAAGINQADLVRLAGPIDAGG